MSRTAMSLGMNVRLQIVPVRPILPWSYIRSNAGQESVFTNCTFDNNNNFGNSYSRGILTVYGYDDWGLGGATVSLSENCTFTNNSSTAVVLLR